MKPAHPNKIPFNGILTRLDEPSDKPPNGARSHRVILPTATAEEAIPTLIGMAVAFKGAWDGHDARQKCGVISEAEIVGDGLCVRGYLYGKDFPEVVQQMARTDVALGMSYEMVDCTVEDQRAEVWVLTKVIFTGAAILLCDKAAYRRTSIVLSASVENDEEFTGQLVGEGSLEVKWDG